METAESAFLSRFIMERGDSMRRVMLLLLFACLFSARGSWAFERFPVISTSEVQELLKQRGDGKTDFVLLNTLDEIIYRHQSIPGSTNIPWNVIASRYTELGPDKDRLIVTYCIGHR